MFISTLGLRRLVLVASGLILACPLARGQPQPTQPAPRDGQHDFDFELGRWQTKVRRLAQPLTGAKAWVEYSGTSIVRGVANGRANLIELDVAGEAGRIEGASWRLYNPQTRLWSIHFASMRDGELTPPVHGRFERGRGEFYGQDTLDGRPIFVRFVISNITPTSAHFEQTFSDDDGKTWKVNWIADDTRTAAPDLAQVVKEYDQTQLHNDVATLERLVADDYVLVNSDGTVENKQQFLADFRLPGFKIEPYVLEDRIEKASGDAAVTGGLVRLRWTQDGKHQTRVVRIAYVWTKRDGRWQATYTQVTRAPQ